MSYINFVYIIFILCSIIINNIFSTSLTSVEITDLQPINGTSNFRIYGKKSKDEKPWFDGRSDMRHQCVRPGRCESLAFNTCFGSKISYSQTSTDLTDCKNQEKIREQLNKYQALQHVPKCWAVVQPFLCAVFVPKCEKIKNEEMVYLPSLEMCTKTLEPCRIFFNSSYFPEFLKCNETLFPSKCNNDVREMKFNTTGRCLEPLLVPVETPSSYFEGIETCGIQCKNPLFTNDDHRQIHKLIGWGSTICFLCNLFVVSTFYIDWQNANKYPAVIVCYMNFCYLMVCIGWLIQFTPGSRQDIVCRKDGTIRHSEPSAGENLSCTVVFVLVYYFLTAAMVWFIIFVICLWYAWNRRAVGVQDRIDKKGSYFHLVSWSVPLILTIIIMAFSEIDGNSIVGICFLGYKNHYIRFAFLCVPLLFILLIGGIFVLIGMKKLSSLKNFLNENKQTKQTTKIHLVFVRMGIFSALQFLFIVSSLYIHYRTYLDSNLWQYDLKKFVICEISSTFTDDHEKCKIENRPSVALLQSHLLCMFGSGIVMSFWCWTNSSIETWKRYIKKKLGQEINEDIKMHKHKVIKQTYAKRKEFEDKGRLSITIYNTHSDPVGLNFDVNDLNSSATNEISSSWANYLPHCVQRRFALTGAATNSSSHGNAPRKSSLDSEISFSVRHVSVESRRNSVDSQVSVKIAEMKTKVARSSRSKHAHSKATRNRNRRDIFATSAGRKFSSGRRESSTSVESQVIALKKTSYPNNTHKVGLFSHSKTSSKRRDAGLDPDDFKKFLTPFLQNQGMTSSSDDDETSMKIQDSRLDVVLRYLSDDENGIKIEEKEFSSESPNKMKQILPASPQLQKSLSLDNIYSRTTNKDRYDTPPSRQSKNSSKSRVSRKSSTQNLHTLRQSKCKSNKTTSTTTNVNNKNQNISSGTSSEYSESELDVPIQTTNNSSYSGLSLCGVNGKNSRNSKKSCDIGVQANSIDILKSSGNNDIVKRTIAQKLNSRSRKASDNDRSYLNGTHNNNEEFHHLIPIFTKNNAIIMSESEKLKNLLLPSK